MLDLKVIRGDFRNNYRMDYQVSQDWMTQQKFVELVVVDVYGLEN
ncbi:hypothetical protein Tco_1372009, partial [Tanacetum coccineum]